MRTLTTNLTGCYALTTHLGGDFSIAWNGPRGDVGDSPLDGIKCDLGGTGFIPRQGDPVALSYQERLDLFNFWEKKAEEAAATGDFEAEKFAIDVALKVAEGFNDEGNKSSRQKRGRAGLTVYGRKSIRSGCTYLEKHYGRTCLSFFTATIGGLTDDEMVVVRDRWAEIVRQFCQKLTRGAARAGLPQEYVSATEIQPKRWLNRGEVVPHLHMIFPGRKSRRSPWAYSIPVLQGWWEESVSNVVGRSVRFPTGTNVQGVKKSAANYMAKYLSKGGEMLQKIKDKLPDVSLPTAWWGCSKLVKAAIKKGKRVMRLPPVALDDLLTYLEKMGYIFYVKAFYLPPDDEGMSSGRTVAIYGRVPPERVGRLRYQVMGCAGNL